MLAHTFPAEIAYPIVMTLGLAVVAATWRLSSRLSKIEGRLQHLETLLLELRDDREF